MDILLSIIAFILILVGIGGIILPGIPDLPLAYAGLVLRSAATDFIQPSLSLLLILLVLVGSISIIELLAGPAIVQKLGGSRSGVIGALVGSIAGLLLAPVSPLWLLLGPLVGALVGELHAGRPHGLAVKIAAGTALSVIIVFGFKILVGLGFIVLFGLSFL